jgi:hypothetical protein
MNVSKAIPNSAQTQWVEIASGKRKKIPRVTPRGELDRLIDWYEANKPDMPKVMPGGIALEENQVARFASKLASGVYAYRGWRLEIADALPKAEKRMKIAKPKKARRRASVQLGEERGV